MPPSHEVDFMQVQGVEHPVPWLYVNGNPPQLPESALLPALGIAVTCLLLVLVVQSVLRRLATRWPRRTRTAVRWIAPPLLAVGFLGLWEAALRLATSSMATPTYVPDPVLYWKMNPEYVRQVFHVDPESWGKADIFSDAPASKPPGKQRVLCLGDSQLVFTSRDTTGMAASTYPALLEEMLGPDWEVVNGGVPGYTSFQGLNLLLHRGLELQPDVVVVSFGQHDSRVAYAPDRDVLTDSPWIFSLRKLIYGTRVGQAVRQWTMRSSAAAAAGHGTLRYPRVSLEEYEDNLGRLLALSRQHGFRLVLVAEPNRGAPVQHEPIRDYWEVVRAFGKAHGVTVCDAGAALAREPTLITSVFFDQTHFTASGHRWMAQQLLDALAEAAPPAAAR